MKFRIEHRAGRAAIGGAILPIILALIIMSQSLPAQVDRTKQPAPDPPPTATFPHYEEFTLSNGLKVFLVHDPRPLVTFRMIVRGGNGTDGDIPGLADAVASQMTRGTKSHTALDFASQIDFVGGSINASAGPDFISINAGGLRKHMPKILELFADAVIAPTFAADELKKYQQEQITGLKSSKAQSEFLAEYGVNKVLFGDSPYGRMPTEDGYRKLTSAKLNEYHAIYFVPSNATLAVIGNFTQAELTQLLEASFAKWTAHAAPAMTQPNFPQLKGRRIVLIDRPTAVQSAIRVLGKGPLLNEPDRPRAFVLNSILGGGTGLGNRLAMNLRETHAYTYTPFSQFDANLYRGYFVATADVRNDVTDSALKETFYEIERIQSEQVPTEELQRNVQSSVGGFLLSVADPAIVAVRVQSIDFYGLPKDYYEKLVGVYSSVTPDNVMDLARRFLNSADLTVVVVGKASEVKSKLERFGTVELWNSDLVPIDEHAAQGSNDIKMTAQQAWDKMLDAMGGKKKLRSVKTMETKASITGNLGPNSIKGTLNKTEEAPNKIYSLYDLGVFKQELSSDGKSVRRSGSSGKLEELPADARDKTLEDVHMFPEAYTDELKGKLNMVGWRDLDGKRALAVEVIYPKNGSVIYYLDPTTYLPLAQESEEGGRITFKEWHEYDGIQLASKLSLEPQAGVVIELSNFNYTINGKVDEGLFKKK